MSCSALRRLAGLALLLLLLVGSPAWAQPTAAPADRPPDARPLLQALATDTAPILDGDVHGDPVWAEAQPVETFWQTTPNEGAPSSERTVVRVLYTASTLYIGVICYDREPDRIIVSDSRRDASLDETDSFRLILDTYQNQQTGFVFGTNPAGIEYDAQVTNEGEGGFGGGRQQAGSGGGFNINWDGAWEVATQIHSEGWTAEFAIPFRTLRYPNTAVQTWGVNFQRNIRRRNEQAYWAPLPRQSNLNRVSLAGTLAGVQVPSLRNLKVMPYVLGQSRRDYPGPNRASATDTNGDFGVDLKYSLSPSLTLDATYNTDFAQVEVDDQQVNLDRFSLFFPEKRPFFLENAGLFSVAEPAEVELFFSRRIGIGPGGSTVPILGGARLSGNVGQTRVGFLNMQTQSVEGIVAANNFTVARVQQELPNRSAVGALITNRQGTGDFAADRDFNRLFAVDARVGVRQNGTLSGFFARTDTPALGDISQFAYNVQGAYNSEKWRMQLGITEVSEGFNPEMGFLQRSAYRKLGGFILRTIRPNDFLGLQEIRPHTSYRGYWRTDQADDDRFLGFQETGYWHIDSHWEWKAGHEIHTGYNRTREGVLGAFTLADGVVIRPGTYSHQEAQIVGWTNRGAPVSFNTRIVVGGFFGGERVTGTYGLQLRWQEAFTTEVVYSRSDLTFSGETARVNLVQTRLTYAFSPRLYLQGLVQYNDQADLWSANLRLGWLRAANTGLFVVYNQVNALDAGLGEVQVRGLTIKYTHLFDVLR